MRTSTEPILLTLLGTLLISAACGPSLKSKLNGKWKATGQSTIWEFKSDGSVRVVSTANGQENVVAAGTYRVIDGETVELKWEHRTDNVKVKAGSNGELNMTRPDGLQMTLTRAS